MSAHGRAGDDSSALRVLALLQSLNSAEEGIEEVQALWPDDLDDATRMLSATLTLLSSVYEVYAEERDECPHCLVEEMREEIVCRIAAGVIGRCGWS